MAKSELKPLLKLLETLDSKDLKDFLEGILTPAEIEQIGKRIEIIRMLKTGVPQHEISAKLGVGVATVTRGSKMLKDGHFEYI